MAETMLIYTVSQNNFAKCKPIFEILPLLKEHEISNITYIKNFLHTLIMLLHDLVKCTTSYYWTVSNMIYAVSNDQQTVVQVIDILNTQLIDTLWMMPQIMYATRPR